MLQGLDAQSRLHLRSFVGQVGFLAIISLPMLLVDSHAPTLYLTQLHALFGFTGLVMIAIGVFTRRPLLPSSFCIWDHCLALTLLKSGCSVALWLLG